MGWSWLAMGAGGTGEFPQRNLEGFWGPRFKRSVSNRTSHHLHVCSSLEILSDSDDLDLLHGWNMDSIRNRNPFKDLAVAADEDGKVAKVNQIIGLFTFIYIHTIQRFLT